VEHGEVSGGRVNKGGGCKQHCSIHCSIQCSIAVPSVCGIVQGACDRLLPPEIADAGCSRVDQIRFGVGLQEQTWDMLRTIHKMGKGRNKRLLGHGPNEYCSGIF
jgi:hypothetical protein